MNLVNHLFIYEATFGGSAYTQLFGDWQVTQRSCLSRQVADDLDAHGSFVDLCIVVMMTDELFR